VSRRSTGFALLAVVAGAAACSDNSVTPTEPSPIAPSAALQETMWRNPDAHIMPTKAQAQAAHNTAGGGGSGTGIFYHGGPVLQSGTKVAAVYWAASPIYTGGPAAGTSGAGSADGSLVGFFMSHLGGSPYFNINSTYTDGSGRKIVNAVTYTQYYANNTSVPANGASVSDAQMIAMLQAAFDAGKLTYDAGTLYNIFTAGTVNLGGGFGTSYCAYHTHGTVTIGGVAKTVLYSAMPYDYAHASACTNGTAAPNGDPGADAEVNTLGHEIEETTTDMMGTAWYDRRGYENADKCAWTWGTTYKTANGGIANMNLGGKDFLVQRNWVNAGSGGCALSY
jgi:hypothetical protein